MNICILDFESTGLNYLKDEIIETSLKIYNKNIWYNSISKPDYRGKLGAYVTPLITEITNISNKMIHKGISQEQLAKDIFNFIIQNNVKYIIAHNGSKFDFIMLELLLKKFNYHIDIKYIDSIHLIKNIYNQTNVNCKSYSQENLCNKYLINQKNAHRAFDDVKTLETLINTVLIEYSLKINKKNISYQHIYSLTKFTKLYSVSLCKHIQLLNMFVKSINRTIKIKNICVYELNDLLKYNYIYKFHLKYYTKINYEGNYDLLFSK